MITIAGYDELDKLFKALGPALNHNILGAAHLASSKPLVEREKMLAPKRKGTLVRSIGAYRTTKKKAKEIGEVIVGPRRSVGYKAYHAHLVEYGTEPRYNKSGAYRGIMPAHPYVQPAFPATKEQVEALIASNIGKAAARIMKKYV